jgi:hypothetical protein
MVTTSSSKEEVKFRAKKKTVLPKKKRQSWDETYADLVKYQKEHDGDCNVKHRDKVYGGLGQWVTKQKRVKDSLQQDQIDRLNAISFNWDKQAAGHDKCWDIQFEHLCDYKRTLGDCKVPITYDADPKLAHWVVHQRGLYRKRTLRQDREERLDKIGMIWTIHVPYERSTTFADNKWKDMYDRMNEFKTKHGHCLVPRDYEEDKKLSTWVANQRTIYWEGRQPLDRVTSLEEIGFVWKIDHYDAETSLHQRHWDELFERLVRYKELKGHTQVKSGSWDDDDPELGRWVHMQRSFYHKKERYLTAERKQRLDSIDFWWGRNDENDDQGDLYDRQLKLQWNEMFKRLKKYKRKHGDLLVHTNKADHHNLGNWVQLQRLMHHRNSILPERKKKLDSVGFPWVTRELRIDKQWMTMYEKLLEFQLEYNHCMVNPKYDEKLARWVLKQRKEFKEEIMSNERRELLEEVEFTWKIGTGKRDRDTYMWK